MNTPTRWEADEWTVYEIQDGKHNKIAITELREFARIIASDHNEAQEWREAIVALIESLPQPTKSEICAKLARMIPWVWNSLSAEDKAQAKIVLHEIA